MQSKIDRSHKNSLCRFRKKADESIDHVVKGCSKLAQNKYKRRHYNQGMIVCWKLVMKCNTEVKSKCYEHKAKNILENGDCNIVWDFSITLTA